MSESAPGKILVVDDDARNVRLLESLLKGEGHAVVTADSGAAALEAVKRAPPDVVLLDVMMPDMDGFEVARRLKSDAATRAIPIIMVTALDDRTSRIAALEAGAEDFLTKPVDRTELLTRVRNLLRLKEYGDFLARHNEILEVKVAERSRLIERLSRVRAVSSGINGLIVRMRDRDELFNGACRIAVEAGGFLMAWVGVVDRDAMRIKQVAWHGVGEDFLKLIRLGIGDAAPEELGIAARAVRERKSMITADMTQDPRVLLRARARELGFRSLVILPLLVADEAVGILALYAGEIGFFDEGEMKLLHELAGNIAFALDHLEKAGRLQVETAERARAEASVRRLNRVHAVLSGINTLIVRVRDREELFREACRIAVEAGGLPLAWVGVVDQEAMQVKPVAWHGAGSDYIHLAPAERPIGPSAEGRGLAGQAVRGGKAVIVDDIAHDPRSVLRKEALERGFRSLVFLPLSVGEKVFGVLALYASEAGFFNQEEMKLLNELAGDISFAVDHIEKSERVDYLAYYDSLTGLANRTLFHERLSQHLHAAQRSQGKLALVLADIERFRTINDSLGRQAGDELLKQLAGRLAGAADTDNVARTGPDHFAIVLPEIKGRSEVARTLERIWRECFAQPFNVGETELRIAARSGIALYPSDGADADALFMSAEAALTKAQETGERHLFHSRELTAGVVDQFALENRLRQALERDEFVLHYQPKVDLETWSIVGVEALIRWQHPERGLVPPMHFIPLLEETGLILEVGAWALGRAAADHARWLGEGIAAPRIAVNVSAIQLRRRDFVATVEQALKLGAASPGIDLEITESLIMEDVQGSIEKLKAVRNLGLSIAIDDFGTGYSSLGYLAKLPVQTLKIDRSFIITMLNDPDTMTLVQTIISLAHSLRLSVVAEGVEQEEQAKVLRLLRCDEMQGYLFSKPVPYEAMTVLLVRAKSAWKTSE